MAIPNYTKAVVTTNFVFTGAFQRPTGAVIPNSFFTAGKKYLIIASAQVEGNSTSGNYGVRMRHGSTVFPSSDLNFEPASSSSRYQYQWFHIWDAIASEDIEMQVNEINATSNGEIDQIVITVIELDSQLFTEGKDYIYNDPGVQATNPPVGSFTTGATNAPITFTPDNDGDEWLVLGMQQYSPADTAQNANFRMERSGEATSLTPDSSQEGEDTANDQMIHLLARVFTLGAVSNTFEMSMSRDSGGSPGTRTWAKTLAIRLNNFKNFAATYVNGTALSDDGNSLSSANEVATVDFTPSGLNDVFLFATMVKRNFGSDHIKMRTQFENSDKPATQTSNNYNQLDGWDSSDDLPWMLLDIEDTPDNTSHNWDMDASANEEVQVGMRTMVQIELDTVANFETYSTDALLRATLDNDFTADSIIVNRNEDVFSVDALVGFQTFDNVFTNDAIVITRLTTVFTVDANVKLQQTLAYTLDSFIRAPLTTTFLTDAMVQSLGVNGVCGDPIYF